MKKILLAFILMVVLIIIIIMITEYIDMKKQIFSLKNIAKIQEEEIQNISGAIDSIFKTECCEINDKDILVLERIRYMEWDKKYGSNYKERYIEFKKMVIYYYNKEYIIVPIDTELWFSEDKIIIIPFLNNIRNVDTPNPNIMVRKSIGVINGKEVFLNLPPKPVYEESDFYNINGERQIPIFKTDKVNVYKR